MPEPLREDLAFEFVSQVDEVFELALDGKRRGRVAKG